MSFHCQQSRVLITFLLVGLPTAFVRADDPQKQSTPPAETPLGQFLGELFDRAEGKDPPPAGQREPAEETLPQIEPRRTILPDAFDDRAIAGREQQRELERAERLLQTGDTFPGLILLQRLLDADEDALILDDHGEWRSLQRTVEQRLEARGADVKEMYVQRFGPLGEERLEQARGTGRPEDFADVAKRYLHTPAGRDAARILSQLMRDIGEPAEAAYWTARSGDERPGPASELQLESVSQTALPQWPQPFGTAAHTGHALPADPVLIQRWSAPIAVRPAVVEQIEGLIRDLEDNSRACIPAAIPLAVNGRIVVRTLRGVSVFDAQSGQPQWESVEGVSVERLLSGEPLPTPGEESTDRQVRPIPAYDGNNADGHPLTGLLFRDGVYGQISSDGDQVFVLEDHASLSYRQPGYFWGQRIEDDPYGRDWSTNQLVAYDLEQGTVRWRIGGEQFDEPFDLALAGTLFLGPPVIDGDELFIIGEQRGAISLFVLDSTTGEPVWSHALSGVGAPITQDLVRRWWPAQPAVGAGLIICPSTTGWMVAIDRQQRRIRWTYRYIESRQKKVSSNRSRVASAGPLNARWAPAAPILTPRFVLFTPSELPDPLYGDQPRLICLDRLTGERVWWEEKDTRLYIGGVTNETVLLVANDAIEARDLSTKKLRWRTPFHVGQGDFEEGSPATTGLVLDNVGQPSGRGVLAGGEYLLPLSSGQLWTIDVATGKVLRTMALSSDERSLGNLLAYRGRLVSADPIALRCFESRADITAELAQTASTKPATSWLRTAELQFVEGDFAGVVKSLRSLDETELTTTQQGRLQQLRWDALMQHVAVNVDDSDALFVELSQLAETDQQRVAVEQVRATRCLAQGDILRAFEIYWALAESPKDVSVQRGATSVQFAPWLAGRLAEVWGQASEHQRHQMDETIRDATESMQTGTSSSQAFWVELLQFHPLGWELQLAAADQAMADEQWTIAEMSLLKVLEGPADDATRYTALERLTRLLNQQDRDRDAAAYLQTYADSVSAGELLRQSVEGRLPQDWRQTRVRWSDGQWALSRSPASFNRAMFEPVLAIDAALPSLNELSFRVDPSLQRLAVDHLDGSDRWETPLQEQSNSFYNQSTGIASVGPVLLVVHRGVLQAISATEQETLWDTRFDLQSASGGHVRGPTVVRYHELRTAQNFLWSSGLLQTRTPMGMLAVWRPGYVVYFGRGSITLADPLTGRVRWTRTGIAARTMVYGTPERLYVLPPASKEAYALSVIDGSPVDVPYLRSLVKSAVALSDDELIQVEERKPFRLLGWGEATTRISAVDPLTGDTRWSESFPEETRFALLSETSLLAVDPDGAVSLIDCRAGQTRLLGSIGSQVMEESQRLLAVAEPGRIYLAINAPPRPGAYSRSYQSATVNGTLAAFDTRGGLLWREVVKDQNLIVDQLAHLPALVMCSQRTEREDDVTSQKVFVELRDKQSGTLLLEEQRYITGGNVREMKIDTSEQFIDLNTYKDRLRLHIAPE